MKFSAATTKELKHYVYGLVDPDDKSVYYVGKASANNRPFQHLSKSGRQPEVEILRYGLSSRESAEVEASIIDALGLENLENIVRGHGVDRGRQTAREIENRYGSKPVAVESIQESYMLFFINQTYSPTMSEIEVYDCTRQFWHSVAEATRTRQPKTKQFLYPVALAIVESVVVRAYSVAEWFRAGTTLSTRKIAKANRNHRWEFVGQLIEKHPLISRRLTKDTRNLPGNQLGYGYLN